MPETNKPSAVHEDWDERFRAIPFSLTASNEWYAVPPHMADEREAIKQEFIKNDALVEPRLTYPLLTGEAINPLEPIYQRLLDDATTDEQYERAARKIAEMYRHKEILRKIGETSFRSAQSGERAAMMMAEIFGDIDVDMYLGMVGNLRQEAQGLAGVMPEAQELLELLGDVEPTGWKNPGVLEQETIDTLHDDFEVLWPGALALFDDARDMEIVPPEQSEQYGQALLDHFGLGAQGWRYVIVPNSHVKAKTNAAEKTITVGELTAHYDPIQMIKSDFHEVTHALRLSGKFIRSNAAFEEAFCVAVEQIITGQIRLGSGEQYYTTLGVQQGLDKNGKPRNFRESYEIMWRRALVMAASKGQDLTIQKAKEKAYTEVMRTRRGGAVDNRDISYFNGSQVVPKWLNDLAKHPKEERTRLLRWVISGSFDPTNPEHTADYPPEAVAS